MTRTRISKDVFSQVVTVPLLHTEIALIGRMRPCDCQLGRAAFVSAGCTGNWPGPAWRRAGRPADWRGLACRDRAEGRGRAAWRLAPAADAQRGGHAADGVLGGSPADEPPRAHP